MIIVSFSTLDCKEVRRGRGEGGGGGGGGGEGRKGRGRREKKGGEGREGEGRGEGRVVGGGGRGQKGEGEEGEEGRGGERGGGERGRESGGGGGGGGGGRKKEGRGMKQRSGREERYIGGGMSCTSVLDVGMPFEKIVCSSVVGPKDSIDRVKGVMQLKPSWELDSREYTLVKHKSPDTENNTYLLQHAPPPTVFWSRWLVGVGVASPPLPLTPPVMRGEESLNWCCSHIVCNTGCVGDGETRSI